MIEVILLKEVNKIGKAGEIKNVSPGFARNFLFPRKLAEPALPAKISQLKAKSEKETRKKEQEKRKSEKIIDRICQSKITIKAKANKEGRLFAAVKEDDIIKEIEKTAGLKLDKGKIIIEKPPKEIGPAEIELKIGPEKRKITLNIVSA